MIRSQGTIASLLKQQIQEILLRFRKMAIKVAKVSTLDHPFFIPAKRMYAACGFREVRRIPWERDPTKRMIEYEMQINNVRWY